MALAPDLPLSAASHPLLRCLGRADYEPTWRAMQAFTEQRGPDTPDEIWFLEHPPVFTLGMNAAPEHVLAPGDIPLVQIDRGGQVTYHGPGQLVVYPLLDVRRCGLGVRQLVMALENGIIALLASWNITAVGRRRSPGGRCGWRWRAVRAGCLSARTGRSFLTRGITGALSF